MDKFWKYNETVSIIRFKGIFHDEFRKIEQPLEFAERSTMSQDSETCAVKTR